MVPTNSESFPEAKGYQDDFLLKQFHTTKLTQEKPSQQNVFDMKNCTWNLKHQNHVTCSVSIGFLTPYQFYHFTQENPGHKHKLQLQILALGFTVLWGKCSCPTISEMHTCIVILWQGHAQAVTWKKIEIMTIHLLRAAKRFT